MNPLAQGSNPTLAKIASVLPEALILSLLAAMSVALWGLGDTAHSSLPESSSSKGIAPAVATNLVTTVKSAFAPLPEDLSIDSLESVNLDNEKIHLPQIADILNAAPEIPAIKIDLPPPAPMIVETAPIPYTHRLEHARELLGKFYKRSVVRSGEKVAQVSQFVRERTKKALRPEFKKLSKVIAESVLKESNRHGFDPVFLMAVIENESSFNPHIVGSVGEVGLMQITPATADWVAKKFNIKYRGKKTLRDPKTNIRLGAAYLSYLRDQFDSHSRLYLAAYNMGSHNVHRARAHSIWPKDYPIRVMKRYIRYYGDLKSEIKPPKT